jgi:hypothetical protein
LRTLLPWLLLPLLCISCGRSADKDLTAASLEEARVLAAEQGSFIVIEFWRHG